MSLCEHLPKSINNYIFRLKHELEFIKVMSEFKSMVKNPLWDLSRLRIIICSMANLFSVIVYNNGILGHNILIKSANSEIQHSVGFTWLPYSTNTTLYTHENEFCKLYYVNWREELQNDYIQMRLMFSIIPNLPEFQEVIHLNTSDFFYKNRYHSDFFVVKVIIHKNAVTVTNIPLTNTQIAIKYNFLIDLKYVQMMYSKITDNTNYGINNDENYNKENIIITLFEYLIYRPTILIYNKKIRNKIIKLLNILDQKYTKLIQRTKWMFEEIQLHPMYN